MSSGKRLWQKRNGIPELPNMWIKSDISNIIVENQDAIQIIRGFRQCGKSILILHLDPDFRELFENLVFSEIYHWRSRDGEEIDFLIQKNPDDFIFVEAKVSPVSARNHTDFPEVRKVFKQNPPRLIICHQEGEHILDGKVPIAKLKKFLLT